MMTGKQKSHEQVRKAARSADLGQKEAAEEKASEEELRHMGNAEAAKAARKKKEKEPSK
jgi:hypothetical protein